MHYQDLHNTGRSHMVVITICGNQAGRPPDPPQQQSGFTSATLHDRDLLDGSGQCSRVALTVARTPSIARSRRIPETVPT